MQLHSHATLDYNRGATSCSCPIYITSAWLGPTWPGCTTELTGQTMFLYNISSMLLQSPSTWQATGSSSLPPGQRGHFHCYCIPHFTNIYSINSDPGPSPVDGTPLVTLNCPSAFHNCQEGVLGDCSLRSGIESDPGEYQVWLLHPGSLHYTSTCSQFLSTWWATCSFSQLPSQRGNSQYKNPPLSQPLGCSLFPNSYSGDFSTAGGTLLVTWDGLYGRHSCQKGDTGDQLVHGGIRGCRGFGCYWPFDPGPLGHRDPLLAAAARKVSPIECLLQLGLLMNAVTSCLQQMAVCQTHSTHTGYAQSTQLCLPEGKSMTPDSCITLAVYRLHLRPLKSLVHSPGSIIRQCTEPLPCQRLPLFQASTKQPTFQVPDPGLKESW